LAGALAGLNVPGGTVQRSVFVAAFPALVSELTPHGTFHQLGPAAPGLAGAETPGSAGKPDDAPADGVYRLNSDQIPAAFQSTGTYSVSDAGLKPFDSKSLVITREKDFLSKDFLFEANVDVPLKEDWIIMGLGDGTEKGSLRLVIRRDAGWGWRAFLTKGDEWGKRIGDIRVAGPRVLRIERHGTSVTVAAGVDNAGKFESDMSQTIPDAKAAVEELSEHQAHCLLPAKPTGANYAF
jgi:hypothetical protein